MNFINDRELALRFKNNAVPSRERLLYLLLLLIPFSMVTSTLAINALATEFANHWDNIIDVLYVITTLIGTIICYITNKNGDDKEFIDRYISIGFPIFLQIFLLIFLVYMLGTFYNIYYEIIEEFSETSSYDFLFSFILEIYYFWKLNSSMKLASH